MVRECFRPTMPLTKEPRGNLMRNSFSHAARDPGFLFRTETSSGSPFSRQRQDEAGGAVFLCSSGTGLPLIGTLRACSGISTVVRKERRSDE